MAGRHFSIVSNVSLNSSEIEGYISFLSSNLPAQPTAVNKPYTLPESLIPNYSSEENSQQKYQLIADNIGYYLGNFKKVKLFVVESYDERVFVGTKSGPSYRDINHPEASGFYRVVDSNNREIYLLRKNRYNLKHILAILAHESTHNYLYKHRLRKSNIRENEILTDIASAFLGLGHIVAPGYVPITWETSTFFQKTLHSITLGYVSYDSIVSAIAFSADYRGWSDDDLMEYYRYLKGGISSDITVQLKIKANKLKKARANKAKISELIHKKIETQKAEIAFILDEYHSIEKAIGKLNNGIGIIDINIKTKHGKIFVDIFNVMHSEEYRIQLNHYLKQLEEIKLDSSLDHVLLPIRRKSREIFKTLKTWKKYLKKYNLHN